MIDMKIVSFFTVSILKYSHEYFMYQSAIEQVSNVFNHPVPIFWIHFYPE